MSTTREGDEDRNVAGTGRLLAFSDGVFAIAFTILVLDLVVPPGLSRAELDDALRGLLPNLLSAALSFAVIGRFWLSHHELFDRVRRADAPVLVLNTLLLALIALVPSVTALLAEYGDEFVAVAGYSAVVGAAATVQLALWVRVTGRRLLDADLPRQARLEATFGNAGAAAGFLVAIPVALASPRWAMACWLLTLVPTRGIATRWAARRG